MCWSDGGDDSGSGGSDGGGGVAVVVVVVVETAGVTVASTHRRKIKAFKKEKNLTCKEVQGGQLLERLSHHINNHKR